MELPNYWNAIFNYLHDSWNELFLNCSKHSNGMLVSKVTMLQFVGSHILACALTSWIRSFNILVTVYKRREIVT